MASDEKINLKVVQKYDQYCTDILDKSGRTALYLFHSNENEWVKTKTEGVFFYYKRSMVPFYAFLILNTKLSSANQVEFVTPELQLQLQLPFLLYKNQLGNIHSIWFYSEEDCERLAHNVGGRVREMGGSELKIGARKPMAGISSRSTGGNVATTERSITGNLSQTSQHVESHQSSSDTGGVTPGSGGLDIFQMLSKAKREMHGSQSKAPENSKAAGDFSSGVSSSRQIDLKDLFASSATNKANMAAGQPAPGGPQGFIPFQHVVRPVAQRPNNIQSQISQTDSSAGGMTVEQLERMLVNSSNQDTSFHHPQGHNTSTNGSAKVTLPILQPSPMVVPSHGNDRSTAEHDGDSVIVELLSKMKHTTTPNKRIDDDDDEVVTPGMLARHQPSTASAAVTTGSGSNHRPTPPDNSTSPLQRPAFVASGGGELLHTQQQHHSSSSGLHLTKDQLKEALVFLLQEDHQFLSKIHEAYLKTLERRLNNS